jgi:acetyl-CoA synthetase
LSRIKQQKEREGEKDLSPSSSAVSSSGSQQKLIWEPSKVSIEESNLKQLMDKLEINSYELLVKKSIDDISWWWEICQDKLGIKWSKPYSKVFDISSGIENTTWFPGGELNAVETILDQKLRERANSKVLIWEGEDGSKKTFTYGELSKQVGMFSNYLRGLGVAKGDVIASCLPMLPETIVAMLGTIRVGAIFSPIFCGYGPIAIASRISNSEPKLLVTCDGYFRKGRKIVLKPGIDEALEIAKLNVPTLIVERLEEKDIPIVRNRDFFYKETIAKESSISDLQLMKPDDGALLLYTSGTTGKPKGAVISHCGAVLQPAKEIFFNMDTKPNDIFMWITDIGWMMGPWEIFGVQTVGAAYVIFEGVPDFPSTDRIYRMIEEYRITHLGHSATTVRMIRRHGDEIVRSRNISSLRTLGNTGEPIDPDTWAWEMKAIGGWNCPMINLSGGTEIFGCFLSPSPIVPLKPSTLWGPALGMDSDVFDDLGNSVRQKVGYLVCKKPAPSMTRGFWNDYDRYIETYWSRFPGVWYHGDWAFVDVDGYWFLMGRADDVIKVAGRRVGPAEIESILNSHPLVAESACVGLPDEIKGEKLCCFVIPKSKRGKEEEEIQQSLKKLVAQDLGKTLEPDKIIFVEDLPRTRSGKIIRRLIRAVALGEGSPSDLSTLENPESLEIIRRTWERSEEKIWK